MKIASTMFAVGAVLALSLPVAADPVSADMKCSAVRKVLDAPQPDKTQVARIFLLVEQLLVQMDTANAAKGRTPIFARMSEDGRHSTSAMVTARCDDSPNDTLKQSTVKVYAGIEALGRAVGVNR